MNNTEQTFCKLNAVFLLEGNKLILPERAPVFNMARRDMTTLFTQKWRCNRFGRIGGELSCGNRGTKLPDGG